MVKSFALLSVPILAACSLFQYSGTNETVLQTEENPREVYTQFCASCHGEKVEAFVDRKWKHGNTKAELVKSITEGYADNGMPAWKESLTPLQIDALAQLINESLATVEQYKFDDVPKSNIFVSDGQTVRLDTVAWGIESAWGIEFLPNQNYLVADRIGKLYRVDNKGIKIEIVGIPTVLAEGQGGLLDVELHPKFAENGWIYLSYSRPKKDGNKTLVTTAVVRGKIVGNQWTNQEEILEALPYFPTRHHFGSRIEFDRAGYLYVSVGDRGREKETPQFLTTHGGKIHRLNDDGSIPADNPFVNEKDAIKSIYSFGHRNPQGLALHPETGDLWENEHGPRGGDEINIIRKAANYGWPLVSHGINYDGTTFTNLTEKEGITASQDYYIPSIGPSGMTFVKGGKYPAWEGNIMLGSLRFMYLDRCVLEGNKVVKHEKLLPNIGRLRTVELGPDGYLYVGVEKQGVYRLMPQ